MYHLNSILLRNHGEITGYNKKMVGDVWNIDKSASKRQIDRVKFSMKKLDMLAFATCYTIYSYLTNEQDDQQHVTKLQTKQRPEYDYCSLYYDLMRVYETHDAAANATGVSKRKIAMLKTGDTAKINKSLMAGEFCTLINHTLHQRLEDYIKYPEEYPLPLNSAINTVPMITHQRYIQEEQQASLVRERSLREQAERDIEQIETDHKQELQDKEETVNQYKTILLANSSNNATNLALIDVIPKLFRLIDNVCCESEGDSEEIINRMDDVLTEMSNLIKKFHINYKYEDK